MKKQVCNERGISATNLAINCGIGMAIVTVLLVLCFISDSVFLALIVFIVTSGIFIFFEPRISYFKFSPSAFEVEMSKQLDVLNSKQISGDMSFECVLPNIVSGNDPDTITDHSINLVIEAMGKSDLAWCYLENIVKDSKLSDDEVKDKLNGLINHGYVTELRLNNIKAYGLSSKGQAEFHKIRT